MSILLSAYFPEGIVFAADKNLTMLNLQTHEQDIEVGIGTKILSWPGQSAVVGYCGLGQLRGLFIDEWMRQFISSTREFKDIELLANQLRDLIQTDFNRDYPEGTDIKDEGLIVHLGGFKKINSFIIPVMYHIHNISGLSKDGAYLPAIRNFSIPSDELRKQADSAGVLNPDNYKSWIASVYQKPLGLIWFNNGLCYEAFNIVKSGLWQTLNVLRNSKCIPINTSQTLDDRKAYCKMAVELYGSFFMHHFPPRQRAVGGGVDVIAIPWPNI